MRMREICICSFNYFQKKNTPCPAKESDIDPCQQCDQHYYFFIPVIIMESPAFLADNLSISLAKGTMLLKAVISPFPSILLLKILPNKNQPAIPVILKYEPENILKSCFCSRPESVLIVYLLK